MVIAKLYSDLDGNGRFSKDELIFKGSAEGDGIYDRLEGSSGKIRWDYDDCSPCLRMPFNFLSINPIGSKRVDFFSVGLPSDMPFITIGDQTEAIWNLSCRSQSHDSDWPRQPWRGFHCLAFGLLRVPYRLPRLHIVFQVFASCISSVEPSGSKVFPSRVPSLQFAVMKPCSSGWDSSTHLLSLKLPIVVFFV